MIIIIHQSGLSISNGKPLDFETLIEMKNMPIFVCFAIVILLSCCNSSVGQSKRENSDEGICSQAIFPFRFHTFTPHIYVDAFLNDSLPVRMVYDCAAPFVWLDSTFVDNHYGYESKQTMAFEGIGTSGRQVVKAFQDWSITIAGKREVYPIIPAPDLRSTFNDSIDGVIGLVFIKKHVWAFDFGTHSFDILSTVPDSVQKNWHTLKLVYRDKMYYFEEPATLFVTDNVKISGKMLFDSGMGTDVSLFADVVQTMNVGNLDITKISRTTQGASGSSTNEVFDAKRLVMPNFVVDSVHTWANTDATGHASKAPFKDVVGYFGFGLLQRMGEVVIDFPNQVLYFNPQ